MPIKITQKLGNKKKQFNVLTKEELSELFGGNIARAGEALGRQAELDKNLGILNDEKLPELDSKLTQLDTELGVLEGNLTQLDEDLGILEGNLTQLDEDLGILEGNLGTLDGYFENPSTIPSNYNFFSGIVAEQAWIDSLVANQAWLDNLFVNEAFADRITANEILADTITSNKINVSEFVASNVFANEFVANEGYVDQLIANDVFADKITANEVDIADLFAQTISVGGTISGNYSSTTGWRIQGNGDAEFNSIEIRRGNDYTIGSDGFAIRTETGQINVSRSLRFLEQDGTERFLMYNDQVNTVLTNGRDGEFGGMEFFFDQMRLDSNDFIVLSANNYIRLSTSQIRFDLDNDLLFFNSASATSSSPNNEEGRILLNVNGETRFIKLYRT